MKAYYLYIDNLNFKQLAVTMTSCSKGVLSADNETRKERVLRVKQRMKRIVSDKGMQKALAFQLRSNDIVVAGHRKTGTTWMQQIVHQLRTGGDDDFEDISLVVPLLEAAVDLGQDLEVEQKSLPRCFKVHQWFLPKSSGKYIVTLRNPYSVAYSSYKWNESFGFFKAQEISVEEFVEDCWITPRFDVAGKSYLGFIASWWEHYHNDNVLFVLYEDLIENREAEVKRIAKFMGIKSEENIRVAVEKSSFDYMKTNWEKFNSNALKQACRKAGSIEEAAGLSRGKIRTGTTTEGKEKLPLHVRQLINSKWKEIVEPVTGFSSYQDLRNYIQMLRMHTRGLIESRHNNDCN